MELDDCLLLVVGQPVVTWDAGECWNRNAGPAEWIVSCCRCATAAGTALWKFHDAPKLAASFIEWCGRQFPQVSSSRFRMSGQEESRGLSDQSLQENWSDTDDLKMPVFCPDMTIGSMIHHVNPVGGKFTFLNDFHHPIHGCSRSSIQKIYPECGKRLGITRGSGT